MSTSIAHKIDLDAAYPRCMEVFSAEAQSLSTTRMRIVTRSISSSTPITDIKSDQRSTPTLHVTLSPTSSPSTPTFSRYPNIHVRSTSSISVTSSIRSTLHDSMDDTDVEMEMAQTPVPSFTRTSPDASESESSMGSGSEAEDEQEMEGDTESERDAKFDRAARTSEVEEADISQVRKGIASFAFGLQSHVIGRDALPLPRPNYIRIARHHAKPNPTAGHPIKTQPQPSFPPPSLRRGQSYPPIFKHAGRVYVNSSKIQEMRARKAMASGSGSVSGTSSGSGGMGEMGGVQGGMVGVGGIGPIRNVGNARSPRGRTLSAEHTTGRYEICTELQGGHDQMSRSATSTFGPAGRSLPTLHFKRSSNSSHVSHPYHLHLPMAAQVGQSTTDLASFRFPALPTLSAEPQQRASPVTNAAPATDRCLLLIGPAIAQHLKSGGSVRIRDMEGSIIGTLA